MTEAQAHSHRCPHHRTTAPACYIGLHIYNKTLTMSAILYAATIFASAFLLFLVQPIVSKHILPWFGGSASVWATCLVFFQTLLLLGYAYADQVSRRLTPHRQVGLHAALLAASLLTLPVLAGSDWKPEGSEDPGLYILRLLTATVGLPYLMLSTTGPLLQSWAAQSGEGQGVYRLFSLSNLASLLALLSYPFLIEPWLSVGVQSSVWSAVYTGFAVLCVASGAVLVRKIGAQTSLTPAARASVAGALPMRRLALWVALSAMGSWLLLAVTNHITQNIAGIPFLWILPLTLYLLSFVLCFESDRWYRRALFLPLLLATFAAAAYGLNQSAVSLNIKLAIPLYCAALFIGCMVLHGELSSLRPSTKYLTRFYLAVSLGGALGGILVGLVAPRVLPSFYELGVGFVVTGLLVAVQVRQRRLLLLAAIMGSVGFATMLVMQVRNDLRSTRLLERNFYGRLLVRELHAPNGVTVRRLLHGAILHGEEYLNGSFRGQPTTYYGASSGVGRALAASAGKAGRVVGIVGLGTGTLAAYGQKGDHFRFYDIDPAVIRVAQQEFGYLRSSKARIDIVLGDARLSLEKEAPNDFDVLAIDAFSGDSIPVHLITREAMAIYRRHMKDDGIIAFHVSNRFLALAPVVARLAEDQGMSMVVINDMQAAKPLAASEWVLVARSKALLMQPGIVEAAQPAQMIPGLEVWTDDANNLFRILK